MVGARLFPGVLQWVEGAGARASAACRKDGQTRLCVQPPQCTGRTGCLVAWLFLSEAQAGLPTCQGNPLGYEIIGQLICHLWVLLFPKGLWWVGRQGGEPLGSWRGDESEPGLYTINHSLARVLLFVFFSLVSNTLGRTMGTKQPCCSKGGKVPAGLACLGWAGLMAPVRRILWWEPGYHWR